jgi:glycosyltransferase involved in cell wall biosynthesis
VAIEAMEKRTGPVSQAGERIRVSLVVPIRNEEASLESLIESIRDQSMQPDEVILVDGGSTDRTLQLAKTLTEKDSRFRVISAGDATPGRGRNCGVAVAVNDWIAFTDAGIVLDPSWLQRLIEVVEVDPAVRVVYGNCEVVADSFFTRCAALAYSPRKVLRDGILVRGPFIASSLLQRQVWKCVGGFPDLRAAEDLIFMERVGQAGFKTGWAPAAVVRWQIQRTLGLTFKRFKLYSRHNVLAGRQRYWHYGVARIYLACLPFIALAAAHNLWWSIVPAAIGIARVAKSIWTRREGRGLPWLINPFQFAGVALILLTVDAATFVGWLEALREGYATRWSRHNLLPFEREK